MRDDDALGCARRRTSSVVARRLWFRCERSPDHHLQSRNASRRVIPRRFLLILMSFKAPRRISERSVPTEIPRSLAASCRLMIASSHC